MATPLRIFSSGLIYHIYNRSAGQKTIFHTGKDYDRFIYKMRGYQEKFPTDIMAYCLMPNHFHLLIRPVENPQGSNSAQNFLHRLMTAYGKYYDYHHEEHSGRVFQGTYKAKLIHDDAYYQTVVGYIHSNPVRKKLVKKPEEWVWSSYSALINPTLRVNPKGSAPRVYLTPDPSGAGHKKIYSDFVNNKVAVQNIREWLWMG